MVIDAIAVTARAAVSDTLGLAIVMMSTTIVALTRKNPLVAILTGAMIGLVAGRLGYL
jgi:hypothetical protein